VGNTAGDSGGGVYGGSQIINSIVWGNSPPMGAQIHNTTWPLCSCIEGYTVGGPPGNIGDDPRFCGPDDFHLQPTSRCIDAGTTESCPATDKDGKPRPCDGDGDGYAVCDMGAYKYSWPRVTSVPTRLWVLYR